MIINKNLIKKWSMEHIIITNKYFQINNILTLNNP